MQNRQMLFVKRPVGAVTPDVFELRDAAVREPADGRSWFAISIFLRSVYARSDGRERLQPGAVRIGFASARARGRSSREIAPRRFCGRRYVWGFSPGRTIRVSRRICRSGMSIRRTDRSATVFRFSGCRALPPCGHVEVRQGATGRDGFRLGGKQGGWQCGGTARRCRRAGRG